MVDAAGLLTGVVASQFLAFPDGQQPPRLGLATAIWYGVGTVGAPVVHYAHGNRKRGMASFATRALFPALTGFSGFVLICGVQGEIRHDCVEQGYTVGAFLGVGITAALDAFSFAQVPAKAEVPPKEVWYGAPMIAVDVAGLALGVYAYQRARSERERESEIGAESMLMAEEKKAELSLPLSLFAGTYLLGAVGGPVVHFANGQVPKGFISLGVRLLLPAIVGVGPSTLSYCASVALTSRCSNTGAMYGLLGGTLAVSLFDSISFARKPVETEETAYRPYVIGGPGFVGVGGYW
jgi:hypothetical protein